jgi:hypothetical protein
MLFSRRVYLHVCVYVQGFLRGFDQTVNLILDECHERVFSPNAGVEQVVLGLYIIRGDNVSDNQGTGTHAHGECHMRMRL